MRTTVLTLLLVSLAVAWPAAVAQESAAIPKGMILVPAGSFQMGVDGEEDPSIASPMHEVKLKAFYIDRYEVTNGDYAKFIDAKGYEKKEHWSADGWKWLEKAGRKLPKKWESIRKTLKDDFDKHPVVGVSWFEAEAYAKYAGKRLPTEAEWERAARGTDQRKFPWGNSFEDGYRKKPTGEVGRTVKGGTNAADKSPVGAMDMGGNVAEWTASWLSPYPGTKAKSRYWGKDAIRRLKVARGGSWRFLDEGPRPVEHKCTVTYRMKEYPHDNGYTFVGFRLAKDVPVKKAAPEKKGTDRK
jgi:formylglycine-generating enzyme required for sulfatase activity